MIWQNINRKMIVIEKGQSHTSHITFLIATEALALVGTLLQGFGTLKAKHLKALVYNATKFSTTATLLLSSIISTETRASRVKFFLRIASKIQRENFVSKGDELYVTCYRKCWIHCLARWIKPRMRNRSPNYIAGNSVLSSKVTLRSIIAHSCS